VLDSLDTAPEPARPQLVLNHRHPLVRRLVARPDAPRTATALEALYGQALLQGRHPLRPVDQALLTRTMLGLLEPDHETDDETDDEPGPGHGTQDEEKPR
jgi:molecular chaperone HtpG